MLGYLNPGGLLGGDIPLDLAPAAAIPAAIAVPRSVDVATAEEAIFRVVVEKMANTVRIHIPEHGLDPREFAVVVCGDGVAPLPRNTICWKAM